MLRTNNTSGHKGVSWNKQCEKWQAKIKIPGERKHLGLFTTREAASVAYRKAAKKYFGIYSKL